MSREQGDKGEQRLVHGYERMLERSKAVLEGARKETVPHLHEVIEHAREKAVDLGELTREEAERIGDYLRRDLEDAAHYLSYTGRGLADWLNFDLDLVEARLAELFSKMVDHTRLSLEQLAAEARRCEEVHTGEIVSPGTLRCVNCEKHLHFHGTGHVPPCAKCHGTVFRRTAK